MDKNNEILQRILLKAITLAEQTGEFVMEQAPLLLREFYTWHIVRSTLLLLLGIGLFYAQKRILKALGYTKEDIPILKDLIGNRIPFSRFMKYYYSPDNRILAVGLFLIGGLLSTVLIGLEIFNLAYIFTAPKLYLIEYFLNLNR